MKLIKEIQTSVEDILAKYKRNAEENGCGKRWRGVELSGSEFQTYKVSPENRMFAMKLDLILVFKETVHLSAHKLMIFTSRMCVYAANTNIRMMNPNGTRSVLKSHTGSITDIHVMDIKHHNHVLFSTADCEGKVCIWSVKEASEFPTPNIHIETILSGIDYVTRMESTTMPTSILFYTLLSNGQLNMYNLPRDILSLKETTELGSCTMIIPPSSSNPMSEMCITKDLVVVAPEGLVMGLTPTLGHNNAFQFQPSASICEKVIFLELLSCFCLVVATESYLKLWSIEDHEPPLMTQMYELNLSGYQLQSHLPDDLEANWCIIACPVSSLHPMLHIHVVRNNHNKNSFSIDYISAYDVPHDVYSFQIASGGTENNIGVYLMDRNCIVQMLLQSRPEKDEEKIAQIRETIAVQQEQIHALVDLVGVQSDTVSALTNQLTIMIDETTSAGNTFQRKIQISKVEQKILQLRQRLQQHEANEQSRIHAMMDEFSRTINQTFPKILHETLSKAFQKDKAKLSTTLYPQIISDVKNVSQEAISHAVLDAYENMTCEFRKQSQELQTEITEWHSGLQIAVQRVQGRLSTIELNTSAPIPQEPPAIIFSHESIESLLTQGKFSDAIKLTVKTRKSEDLDFLLNALTDVDKDNVLGNGEISVDAAVAFLTALGQNLKDIATIDVRVEWIQAIGLCEPIMSKKKDMKATLLLAAERLSEVKGKDEFSAATKRNVKLALKLLSC